ncbi:MAG: 6-bladed beta-propeller [Pirellulales bacterium]
MVKTDLTGKILYTLGNVDKESDTAQKFDFVNPTDVAVAPNGDIYIVDGYGSFKMHRFDKNFRFIKTIGTKGKAHGEFSNNHGVWINTLKKEPELYVADRGNSRIEVYSLEMEYKRTHGEVRKPCCFYQHDGLLWIPDLQKRITVYDADDKVAAQLGDSQGVDEKQIEQHPDKFAQPHALCLSSTGDLYVVEWLPYGRVRKFKHTPV